MSDDSLSPSNDYHSADASDADEYDDDGTDHPDDEDEDEEDAELGGRKKRSRSRSCKGLFAIVPKPEDGAPWLACWKKPPNPAKLRYPGRQSDEYLARMNTPFLEGIDELTPAFFLARLAQMKRRYPIVRLGPFNDNIKRTICRAIKQQFHEHRICWMAEIARLLSIDTVHLKALVVFDESYVKQNRSMGGARLSFTRHGWNVFTALYGEQTLPYDPFFMGPAGTARSRTNEYDAQKADVVVADSEFGAQVAERPRGRPGRPPKRVRGRAGVNGGRVGRPPSATSRRARAAAAAGELAEAAVEQASSPTLVSSAAEVGSKRSCAAVRDSTSQRTQATQRGRRRRTTTNNAARRRAVSGAHTSSGASTSSSSTSSSATAGAGISVWTPEAHATLLERGFLALPTLSAATLVGGSSLAGRNLGNVPLSRGSTAELSLAPAEQFNDLTSSPLSDCLGEVMASVHELSRYYEARISSLQSEVDHWKRLATDT